MTAAVAKSSFGIEYWQAPDGDELVKVGDLITLQPPPMNRGVQDATTHDSAGGAEENIAEGVYSNGAITFQIHYVPGSAGDIAMRLALTSGELQDFKIVYPVGTPRKNLTGSGTLTSYEPQDAPVKGKLVANCTMTPTGVVTPGAEAA